MLAALIIIASHCKLTVRCLRLIPILAYLIVVSQKVLQHIIILCAHVTQIQLVSIVLANSFDLGILIWIRRRYSASIDVS